MPVPHPWPALLLPALLLAVLAPPAGAQAKTNGPTCGITKVFVGTAPSDIVQQQFSQHFQAPLNHVDCRDNGLCYQKWGKNCTMAGSNNNP